MSNKLEHRTEIPARQSTHTEAIAIMQLAKTDQQRRANLAFWAEKYGEQYAKRIRDAYQRGVK